MKRQIENEEEPVRKSSRTSADRHGISVGDRIQVLWQISEDKSENKLPEDEELSYFSASVTEITDETTLCLLYDAIPDFSPESKSIVTLKSQDTLYCQTLSVDQKFRREAPSVPKVSAQEATDLTCPNGHFMTRDFADVNVRTCECCLSIYHSDSGEWECKECDDWGACDRCVRLRLAVGHWVLCEELENADDEVVRVTDVVGEFEAATAEAAESLSKMPFEQQSNFARSYNQFVETVSAGLSVLLKEKGADYVVTKADVDEIVKNLKAAQESDSE